MLEQLEPARARPKLGDYTAQGGEHCATVGDGAGGRGVPPEEVMLLAQVHPICMHPICMHAAPRALVALRVVQKRQALRHCLVQKRQVLRQTRTLLNHVELLPVVRRPRLELCTKESAVKAARPRL